MGSRIALGLALLVAGLGAMVGTANAGTTIRSSSTCCTFDAGPYVQDLGDIATFDNSQSTSPHDVVAKQKGPDGKPLFAAAAVLGGQSSTVYGTQYLDAGTYGFYCTIHGPSMSGELIVDPGKGTVVPRPSVKVSVLAQKLGQVKKSGVKVKIQAVTASKNVTVTASLGKVKLGSKGGTTLAAGQSKPLTIPLSKAGRKAISKVKKSVQISVKATLPFGKPATANRRVR